MPGHAGDLCVLALSLSLLPPRTDAAHVLAPRAVLLNDNAIFEHVLRDDVILGVVGILECASSFSRESESEAQADPVLALADDPDFPTMRASYREHLSSPTAFIPVVPPSLVPSSLLAKIHQTHRLHYLKDVVLARILEDSTFSMLNSAIYFNEVDIVNEVAAERELVREVFRVLEDDHASVDAPPSAKGKERDLALGPKRTIGPSLPTDDANGSPASKRARLDSPPRPLSSPAAASASTSTSTSTSNPSAPLDPASPSVAARKLHATLFLQQLSQMAKNLQLGVRTPFYKQLCDRGLLAALEGALRFAAREGARPGASDDERDDAIRMRQAALGVWMCVVDLAPLEVRGYCLRQGKELEKAKRDKEEQETRRTLLGLLIGTLKAEHDLGLKAQLTEALRVLVDVTGEGGPLSVRPLPLPPRRLIIADP